MGARQILKAIYDDRSGVMFGTVGAYSRPGDAPQDFKDIVSFVSKLSWNELDGEAVADYVMQVAVLHKVNVTFGREYSPVLYLGLVGATKGQEAKVMSALKRRFKADEVWKVGDEIRAWWD
jgi:hypothetical protein